MESAPVNIKDHEWKILDEAYALVSRADDAEMDLWLLDQTIATASDRRRLLAEMPLTPGASILDVGTGYGPLALEIARITRAQVFGVDRDDRSLDVARAVATSVRNWLHEGSTVRFDHIDVGDLAQGWRNIAPELASRSNPGFDLAIMRLVLQHLAKPQDAIASVVDTLRHGGLLWIFDVDDGLSTSWPPTSAVYDELELAFRTWQSSYGGDRTIGRKIPSLVADANLLVREVRAVPSAAWSTSRPGDLERTSVVQRIGNAMASMVSGGFITAQDGARLLDSYANEPPITRLRVETQLIVVAQKP